MKDEARLEVDRPVAIAAGEVALRYAAYFGRECF